MSIRPFGIVLYIMGIVFNLFEIILCVNILRLKEWARKYTITLNIAYIVLVFAMPLVEGKSCYLSFEQIAEQRQSQLTPEQKRYVEESRIFKKEWIEKQEERFEESIKKYPPERQEFMRGVHSELQKSSPNVLIFIVIFLQVIFLFWYLLVIFFFTRPKVKEQFK